MNSTTTTTTNAPERTKFRRICSTNFVKNLVKEAKRVGYTVDVFRNGDMNKGSVYGYQVFDPTHDNSLVFKAIAIRPDNWGTTFSKVYWQEPTV